MRFAKQVNGETVRFCRIKRMGTKNCRVVWLDNNEEQLVPVATVEECPAVEAGQGAEAPATNGQAETATVPAAYPTQISGEELCRMMRNYQVSAKELAVRLGIPTEQVREARNTGIDDPKTTLKWITAIQVQPEAVSA